MEGMMCVWNKLIRISHHSQQPFVRVCSGTRIGRFTDSKLYFPLSISISFFVHEYVCVLTYSFCAIHFALFFSVVSHSFDQEPFSSLSFLFGLCTVDEIPIGFLRIQASSAYITQMQLIKGSTFSVFLPWNFSSTNRSRVSFQGEWFCFPLIVSSKEQNRTEHNHHKNKSKVTTTTTST